MRKIILLLALLGTQLHAMSDEYQPYRDAKMRMRTPLLEERSTVIATYNQLIDQPITHVSLQEWNNLHTKAQALLDNPVMRRMATDGSLEQAARISRAIVGVAQGNQFILLDPKIERVIQYNPTILQRISEARKYFIRTKQ